MKLMAGLLLLTVFATTPLTDETRDVRPQIIEYVDEVLDRIHSQRAMSIEQSQFDHLKRVFHNAIQDATRTMTTAQQNEFIEQVSSYIDSHSGQILQQESAKLLDHTHYVLVQLAAVLRVMATHDEIIPTGEHREAIIDQTKALASKGTAMLKEKFPDATNDEPFTFAEKILQRNLRMIDKPMDLTCKRLLTDEEVESLMSEWEKILMDPKEDSALSSNPESFPDSNRKSQIFDRVARMRFAWTNIYKTELDRMMQAISKQVINP